MELARVDALIDRLTSAFESGLDFYGQWKAKLERQNTYQRRDKTSSAPTKCAVTTSLELSLQRITETYYIGFILIGSEFSEGDGMPPNILFTVLMISSHLTLSRPMPPMPNYQRESSREECERYAPSLGLKGPSFSQLARCIRYFRHN